MSDMTELKREHNLQGITSALTRLKGDPWRGWEWDFWSHVVSRPKWIVDPGKYEIGSFNISPDGKLGLSSNTQGVGVFDVHSGRLQCEFATAGFCTFWLRDSRRFLLQGLDGSFCLFGAVSGKLILKRQVNEIMPGIYGCPCVTLPGDGEAIFSTRQGGAVSLNLSTLQTTPLGIGSGIKIGFSEQVSQDGRLVAWASRAQPGQSTILTLADPKSGKTIREVPLHDAIHTISMTGDGRTVAVGSDSGRVYLVDSRTGGVHMYGPFWHTFIQSSAISSDGRMLMVSGKSREAILFEIVNNQLVARQRFDDSNEAGFVPGAREVFTAYDDVRFYDVDGEPETPEVRLRPVSHFGYRSANIGPDGQLVASSSVHLFSGSLLSGRPFRVEPIGGFLATSCPGKILDSAHYRRHAYSK